MTYTLNKKEGLIETVIILIVALLILSYFGLDVQALLESPQVQKNAAYLLALVPEGVWNVMATLWNAAVVALGPIFSVLYDGLQNFDPGDLQNAADLLQESAPTVNLQ